MDAATLLTADHDRVRSLFVRLTQAHDDGDTTATQSLARQVAHELAVPSAVEEPDEVKVLLDEIDGLEAGSEPWVAKMHALMDDVDNGATEDVHEAPGHSATDRRYQLVAAAHG